jgi:hypothetical protein
MTVQSLATVLIALAIVGLLIARQLRWRTFDPARVLRLPIVLGAIGLVELTTVHGVRVTTIDATTVGIELLLSVGIGALMGRFTVFRPGPDGALQTRGGWPGAALWIGLVAVRVAFDALGAALGAHLLTQTGMILLLIAVSRGTAALVIRAREPRAALGSA